MIKAWSPTANGQLSRRTECPTSAQSKSTAKRWHLRRSRGLRESMLRQRRATRGPACPAEWSKPSRTRRGPRRRHRLMNSRSSPRSMSLRQLPTSKRCRIDSRSNSRRPRVRRGLRRLKSSPSVRPTRDLSSAAT